MLRWPLWLRLDRNRIRNPRGLLDKVSDITIGRHHCLPQSMSNCGSGPKCQFKNGMTPGDQFWCAYVHIPHFKEQEITYDKLYLIPENILKTKVSSSSASSGQNQQTTS